MAHSVCCFLVEKNEVNKDEEGFAGTNNKGDSKRSAFGLKQKAKGKRKKEYDFL